MTIKLKIEKLVYGGQALARHDGRVVFLWGALPGEEVEAKIIEEKKNFAVAELVKVLTPAPERIEPVEDHWGSCSPWQIMTEEAENEWKQTATFEMYQKAKGLPVDFELNLYSDVKNFWHYRNKMEYNFTTNESGEICYAFFARDSHDLIAHEGCLLASKKISEASDRVLSWLRESKIEVEKLQKIIFRSNSAGEVLTALFVSDDFILTTTPTEDALLIGFSVYQGKKKLFQQGKKSLVEKIGGLNFRFDCLSFFQINPAVFEVALSDIKKNIAPGDKVLDYYSGVGLIGLSVAQQANTLELVEADEVSTTWAWQNIEDNKIKNAHVLVGSVEANLDKIKKDKTVIFDPPRSGLDRRVLNRLFEELPEKIIYLSCDPATQARDVATLSSEYEIEFAKLYNFFPRTPHVEALMVLIKK